MIFSLICENATSYRLTVQVVVGTWLYYCEQKQSMGIWVHSFFPRILVNFLHQAYNLGVEPKQVTENLKICTQFNFLWLSKQF